MLHRCCSYEGSQQVILFEKAQVPYASEEILQMFYTPTISSVLTFEMTFWGGNASKQEKKKKTRREHQECRWNGGEKAKKHRHSLPSNNYKLRAILADETHTLRSEFDNRHIDRSNIFRILRSKTSRHLQSFIPVSR